MMFAASNGAKEKANQSIFFPFIPFI